jgi:hypothetical protein
VLDSSAMLQTDGRYLFGNLALAQFVQRLAVDA